MSISDTTITEILDRNDVPHLLRTDPELLASAYNLAWLENPPTEGPEARFLTGATLLPGDSPEGPDYEMANHVLLTEIFESRFRTRDWELRCELLQAADEILNPELPAAEPDRDVIPG
ncbi:hypothetical protein [Arthrobacter sp. NPDC056493]|uniref:hypothetical protein n=1 Tax=Arthrobacter sp. NPDC056493 TaxID=3345839 RepID=UPI00366E30E9